MPAGTNRYDSIAKKVSEQTCAEMDSQATQRGRSSTYRAESWQPRKRESDVDDPLSQEIPNPSSLKNTIDIRYIKRNSDCSLEHTNSSRDALLR